MVGIISWGCYIPRLRIKTEEIAKIYGANSDQIKKNLFVNEKSVPDIDEDTATIAVECARNSVAMSKINPKHIGAIYIGSESHPYAVKPTGTIVAQAVGMSNNYMCADFEFACKAGTAAMQVGLGLIKSKMVNYVLAGGCDTAQAAPGDPLEYTAAAGGAVFLLGDKDVLAKINHTISFTSDTPDFWRRSNEKFPAHGGAFTGDPAYYKHVMNCAKKLMEKSKTKPKEYDYAVFHQPNGKFPRRVATRLGFTKEQITSGLIVDQIGNTYSGASLIGLCSVLDVAKPGQRILLVSYGSGAGSDGFDITMKSDKKSIKTVNSYLHNKKYINYSEYLRNIKYIK